MSEWSDYQGLREKYLASVWKIRKRPVTEQVEILEEGLRADRKGDVLAYLHEVESPAFRGIKRPVSEEMLGWLVHVASFPGEWSSNAVDTLEALAKDGQGGDRLFQAVDEEIKERLSDPQDDEKWLYTATMLRHVDTKRFEDFLALCRNHESEYIREVAAFFDE